MTDYGSARFVGIEQKYGGRYLPENKSYASQTIAHNTIIVDETSHFNGREEEAEKYHSDKLFSNSNNSNLQVVSAKDDNAYKNIQLQRTEYLLQLPQGRRMIVDLFNAFSRADHQYDLPFQYSGQLIDASFRYEPFTLKQETLGKKNGYQFLWKEAEAGAANTTVHVTFLNDKTYYTISSLIQDTALLFFTRSGANDPDFNLRHEPAFIIRKNGKNQSFISVIEIHGKYDPVAEFSTNAYPLVKQIKMLQNDEAYSIAEITVEDKKLLIAQSNSDFDLKKKHSVKNIDWTGPCTVWYNGKILN